jgi:hypothetical protein
MSNSFGTGHLILLGVSEILQNVVPTVDFFISLVLETFGNEKGSSADLTGVPRAPRWNPDGSTERQRQSEEGEVKKEKRRIERGVCGSPRPPQI